MKFNLPSWNILSGHYSSHCTLSCVKLVCKKLVVSSITEKKIWSGYFRFLDCPYPVELTNQNKVVSISTCCRAHVFVSKNILLWSLLTTLQEISFAPLSSWSKKKSNNWFQFTTLSGCDNFFSLTQLFTIPAAYIHALVWELRLWHMCGRSMHKLLPLGLPAHTACMYRCKRQGSLYVLPLILCIYNL